MSGPASGRLGQERRVGGVPAQQLGARARRRAAGRPRGPAGARGRSRPRPGSPERRQQRRQHLGERPRAVPGEDGLGQERLGSVGHHGASVSRSRGWSRRRTRVTTPAAGARRPIARCPHGLRVVARPPRRRPRRRRGAARRGAARGCCAWPPPDARCWPAAASPSPTPRRAALARRLLDAGVVHPVAGPRRGPGLQDVTVVVPVKDRTAGRRPPARRAARTDLGGVIVVDDGSADPTACVRSPHAPGRGCCATTTARGPAAARNAGLAAAATPLVAFLDSDVVPDPGWLDAAAGAVRRPGRRAGRAAHRRAARPVQRLARPLRGRAVVARPRARPGAGRAALPGRLRAERRAARAPRRGRGRASTSDDARRRGRRPRPAPARRRLAAALRADVAGRARPPDRPARVVAAQGVLRHGRRPARAAPPRRGAADGAEPVVGRGRRGAARPPPARRRSPSAAWAVAARWSRSCRAAPAPAQPPPG